MKAILISIKPKWCEKIFNGEKTVEVRKTAPKLYDTPKELEVIWSVRCTNKTGNCGKCEVKPACINNITRPPQSWCYVEEIE